MEKVQEKYINLVCIKRVKSGYQSIADLKGVDVEIIREMYSNNGGIQKWIADELGITLLQLGELESNDIVIKKIEKIDRLFKNQFSSSQTRKEGFINFENFYSWYLEQNGRCYYCEILSEDLEKLFDTNKIKSTKFNATLHIEQIDPKKGYNQLNCKLSCSLCNNAKSDLFSKDNYKKYIAPHMKEFLQDLKEGKIENQTF